MAKKAETKKALLYWDACTFISWLDGGIGRTAEDVSGLNAVAQDIQQQKVILATSALTKVEVIGKTSEALENFRAFLKRRNSKSVAVDNGVVDLATTIRIEAAKEDRVIRTADAIHLATAIRYGADVFHTYDAKLLALSGNVAGHSLIVERPSAKQYYLDLIVASDKDEHAEDSDPEEDAEG